jgi:hypothetical protein
MPGRSIATILNGFCGLDIKLRVLGSSLEEDRGTIPDLLINWLRYVSRQAIKLNHV